MKEIVNIVTRILVYIFVFIAAFYLPRDPDLGWHLKYGEYFFQHHQILRENIYSTLMPHYSWANGSWATDIVTYAIFHISGFVGLIIASALIVTFTFFFFAKAAQLTLLEEAIFFPLLVYLEASVNNNSFRGQQISLLLLGILFFIGSKYKSSSKSLWYVPVLFFFWSNLQTESFLGLAVFGLWIGSILLKEVFINKQTFFQESLFLGKVFLITFLATLINPFGWNIHLVALAHLGDPLLKKVSEYVPFSLWSSQWWSQCFVMVIMIVGLIYLLYKKKLRENIHIWAIPVLLLILAFDVRRYAWPAYYLMLPFLHMLWQLLERFVKKYAVVSAAIIVLISITFILHRKMPLRQFTDMSWDTYCAIQSVPCSSASAYYLQKNKLTHNLFTYYDWGGYLIWNYPAVKPSIDGRMHVWRDKTGDSPFADYDEYMNGQKNIDTSSFDVVYIPMDQTLPIATELNELIHQRKWKEVYEDDYAGIIVRVKR